MNREASLEKLKSESLDLLIIGGGITGAGIALDAASRGLKTALIEKKDFAYGTSSRSTKLIHGGLRYLKQLEFGLVKEVGSERAVVHQLAPHLVIPEKMLLPLYEKRGLGSVLTSVGLKLYDWLAGVKPEDQRKMLTRKQTLSREPLLNPQDVKGGAIYAEYRTDDARLTIEIIKTASVHKATIANYCEATDFIYENGKVTGVKAIDHVSGGAFEIHAAMVVNAAGPWVDTLREKDKSKTGKKLHLTKGVHIVVPREKLPVTQAIYFDVGDGRMIFAIPRGRTTYIGTTDTNYAGLIDGVHTEKEDVEYLLRAVNQTFINSQLKSEDVESSWAGLRPLIHEEGKSASELSRKDEIFESPSGLISIAGGKLTGYRKMAERVVDLVVEKKFEERKLLSCLTRSIKLTRASFKNVDEVRRYRNETEKRLKVFQLGDYTDYLVSTYGQQTEEIISLIEKGSSDNEWRLTMAELDFCLENEMLVSASDFLVRRTGMLYFDLPRAKRVFEPVMDELTRHFRWNESQREDQGNEIQRLIQEASSY
ncbi:aerobic glycerol-3-phosphate dehydrogenase [Cytophagales bacterium WSM2-2]|nr:aerobic glycerol-3-phosphate dehydrogenase [Cytophagales bacterium WSM2-2]